MIDEYIADIETRKDYKTEILKQVDENLKIIDLRD
jgi:hypothetical protein